jgi:hypothetical protein
MRLATLLTLGAIACSGGETGKTQTVNRDTLSQRQKDSILAQSKIPGARGVGRAMTVADSTSARVHAADTVGDVP